MPNRFNFVAEQGRFGQTHIMARPSKGIQSVEVGGRLLLALAAHGAPMMLRDLAQAAGMPATKAHPYLVSFGQIGLIEQDSTTGWYRLGALALRLGLVGLQQCEPVRLAAAAADELKARTHHTVTLAVWSARGPTVVRIEEADELVQANLRIGMLMSIVGTATGRVFAAFMPPGRTQAAIREERARLAKAHGAPQETAAHFDAQLADIRRRGLARAIGAPLPGISAFSAPVFDRNGAMALALTVMGPDNKFDAAWEGPIAGALLDVCGRLSAQLGFIQAEPACGPAVSLAGSKEQA